MINKKRPDHTPEDRDSEINDLNELNMESYIKTNQNIHASNQNQFQFKNCIIIHYTVILEELAKKLHSDVAYQSLVDFKLKRIQNIEETLFNHSAVSILIIDIKSKQFLSRLAESKHQTTTLIYGTTKEIESNYGFLKKIATALVTAEWRDIHHYICQVIKSNNQGLSKYLGISTARYADTNSNILYINVFYCHEYEALEQGLNSADKFCRRINYLAWSQVDQIHELMNFDKGHAIKQEATANNFILTDKKNYGKSASLAKTKPNFKIVNLFSEQQKLDYIQQLQQIAQAYKNVILFDIIKRPQLVVCIKRHDSNLIQQIEGCGLRVHIYQNIADLKFQQQQQIYYLIVCDRIQQQIQLQTHTGFKNWKTIAKSIEREKYSGINEYQVLRTTDNLQIAKCINQLRHLRLQLIDPWSVINQQSITLYIKEKNYSLYQQIANILISKKKVVLRQYDRDLNKVTKMEQDTLIVLVVSFDQLKQTLRQLYYQSNLYLIVMASTSNLVTYNKKILQVVHSQSQLLDSIRKIPEIEQKRGVDGSEVKYISNQYSNQIQSNIENTKGQSFVYPTPGKSLVYVHLPRTLAINTDAVAFQNRMISIYKHEIVFEVYNRIDQLRGVALSEQPLSFFLATDEQKKWFVQFNNYQNSNVFVILFSAQNVDKLSTKFCLTTSSYSTIQTFIRNNIKKYIKTLEEDKYPKRYADFCLKETQRLRFCYDVRDSKAKNILDGYKKYNQISHLISYYPFQTLQGLKSQLQGFSDSQNVIVLANQYRKTGTETAITAIINNRNHKTKLITQAEKTHRKINRCVYCSPDLKSIVDWIANIPLLKQKTNSNMDLIIVIDFNNINLDYLRQAFIGKSSMLLQEYRSEAELLQIVEKHTDKSLIIVVIEKEEEEYYFNTLKQYSVKFLIDNNSIADSHTYKNVLCQSNKKNIFNFVSNIGRDNITITKEFFRKEIKILINTQMMSTQAINSIFKCHIENLLLLDRYNSKAELNQYLTGIFGSYDYIICNLHDSINPNLNKLILYDKHIKSVEQKLKYHLVAQNQQVIVKLVKRFQVLKRYNIAGLLDKVQNLNQINVYVPASCRLEGLQSNFSLNIIPYTVLPKLDRNHIVVTKQLKYSLQIQDIKFDNINDESELYEIFKVIPNTALERIKAIKSHKVNLFIYKQTLLEEKKCKEIAVRNPSLRIILFNQIKQLKQLVIRVRNNQQYFIFFNDYDNLDEVLEYKHNLVIIGDNNQLDCITLRQSTDLFKFMYAIPHNTQALPLRRKQNAKVLLMYPHSLKPTPLFNKITDISKTIHDLDYEQYKSIGELMSYALAFDRIIIIARESELQQICNGLTKLEVHSTIKIIVMSQSRDMNNYKYSRVELVTNEFNDVQQYCVNMNSGYQITVTPSETVLAPWYYKYVTKADINYYETQQELYLKLNQMSAQNNIYVIVNKNCELKKYPNLTLLFEGPSKKNIVSSKIQAVSPFQLVEKIKFYKQKKLCVHLYKEYEGFRKFLPDSAKFIFFNDVKSILFKEAFLNLIVLPKALFKNELLKRQDFDINIIVFGDAVQNEHERLLLASQDKEQIMQAINNLKRKSLSHYPIKSRQVTIYFDDTMGEVKSVLMKVRNRNIICCQYTDFSLIENSIIKMSQPTILITRQLKGIFRKNVFQIVLNSDGFNQFLNNKVLFVASTESDLLKYLCCHLKSKTTDILLDSRIEPCADRLYLNDFINKVAKVGQFQEFKDVDELNIKLQKCTQQNQIIVITNHLIQKGNFKLLYNTKNDTLFNDFIMTYFFDEITSDSNKITIYYQANLDELNEQLLSITDKCKRPGVIKLIKFQQPASIKNVPSNQEEVLIIIHKQQSISQLNSLKTSAKKYYLSNVKHAEIETITLDELKSELTKHLNLSQIIENTMIVPFFSDVKASSQLSVFEKVIVADYLNREGLQQYCKSSHSLVYRLYQDSQTIINLIRQLNNADTLVLLVNQHQNSLLLKLLPHFKSSTQVCLLTKHQSKFTSRQFQIRNTYKQYVTCLQNQTYVIIAFLEKLKDNKKLKTSVNPSNLGLMSSIDERAQLANNTISQQDHTQNLSTINQQIYELFKENFLSHPTLKFYIQKGIEQCPEKETVQYFSNANIPSSSQYKIILTKKNVEPIDVEKTRIITINQKKDKRRKAANQLIISQTQVNYVLRKLKGLIKHYRSTTAKTIILQSKDIEQPVLNDLNHVTVLFEKYEQLLNLIKRLSLYEKVQIEINAVDDAHFKNIPMQYNMIVKRYPARISRLSKLKKLQSENSAYINYDIIGIDVPTQKQQKLFLEHLFEKQLVLFFVKDHDLIRIIQNLQRENHRILIKRYVSVKEIPTTKTSVLLTNQKQQFDEFRKLIRNRLNLKIIYVHSTNKIISNVHNIFVAHDIPKVVKLINTVPKIKAAQPNYLTVLFDHEINGKIKQYLFSKESDTIRIAKYTHQDQIEDNILIGNVIVLALQEKLIGILSNLIHPSLKWYKAYGNLSEFYSTIQQMHHNRTRPNFVKINQQNDIISTPTEKSSRFVIKKKHEAREEQKLFASKFKNQYLMQPQKFEDFSITDSKSRHIDKITSLRSQTHKLTILIDEEMGQLKHLIRQNFGLGIKIKKYRTLDTLCNLIVPETRYMIVLNSECIKATKTLKQKYPNAQFIALMRDSYNLDNSKKQYLLAQLESNSKIINFLKSIFIERKISNSASKLRLIAKNKLLIFHRSDQRLIKQELAAYSHITLVEYTTVDKLLKELKILNSLSKSEFAIVIQKGQEVYYIQDLINQPNVKFIRHQAGQAYFPKRKSNVLYESVQQQKIIEYILGYISQDKSLLKSRREGSIVEDKKSKLKTSSSKESLPSIGRLSKIKSQRAIHGSEYFKKN